MARKVIVTAGLTGYRNQLDRARRFLERLEAVQVNDVEFQDMTWAFFQNCWHIKDWLDNDPHVPRPVKVAVITLALQSVALGVCAELCNGTKHLGKTRHKRRGKKADPKSVPKHKHVEVIVDSDGRMEMDCIIDNGAGKLVSGRLLAHQCIAEWIRILSSQGLATARLS